MAGRVRFQVREGPQIQCKALGMTKNGDMMGDIVTLGATKVSISWQLASFARLCD